MSRWRVKWPWGAVEISHEDEEWHPVGSSSLERKMADTLSLFVGGEAWHEDGQYYPDRVEAMAEYVARTHGGEAVLVEPDAAPGEGERVVY